MENQRKIIGVGESILDILFRDGQPVAAVPGGSSFNSIISVGRAGVPCTFVGYSGADIVGQNTVKFLNANGVGTEHFQLRKGEKSAVSLAFIGENKDASYLFYKEPPHVSADFTLPQMSRGDVMLFGSYYAACNGMRLLISEMLERAAKLTRAVLPENERESRTPSSITTSTSVAITATNSRNFGQSSCRTSARAPSYVAVPTTSRSCSPRATRA